MPQDACRTVLNRETFGTVGYVCAFLHVLCGSIVTVVTGDLKGKEEDGFSCSVDHQSMAPYKQQVDNECFLKYKKVYNSPIPLYGFVLLSIGLMAAIGVIYSLCVKKHVRVIESEPTNRKGRSHRIFSFYMGQLILRALCGIIFTLLQHLYFYPSGFNETFSCNLPAKLWKSNLKAPYNGTSTDCTNGTANEMEAWGIFVSVINSFIAFVILIEVAYLFRRRFVTLKDRYPGGWDIDSEFVVVYFTSGQYTCTHGESTPLKRKKNTWRCIQFYKSNILNRPLSPYIYYGTDITLEKVYVDLDIKMEENASPICLENTEKIFQHKEDSRADSTFRILVTGGPGYGKTFFAEKILHDWAQSDESNKFYYHKIAFFFTISSFNASNTEHIELKKFLQLGTKLREETFQMIYEEVKNNPKAAILIFDGLHEFNGNLKECLDQTESISNDPDTPMSRMNLCLKLISGRDMLIGATVLVTSRPLPGGICSSFNMNEVKITGFNYDKIYDHVTRFCHNNHVDKTYNLDAYEIWDNIKSSPQLLELCKTPVNSFIVCVILSGCLSSTLTKIYEGVFWYFKTHDEQLSADGKTENTSTLDYLQELAFNSEKNGQKYVKEIDEHMKGSYFFNSLSKTAFPIRKQFYFAPATMQAFLAARHVTEKFDPSQIKDFILEHIGSNKMSLVLQFIAGLLGQKIMESADEQYQTCLTTCLTTFVESVTVSFGCHGQNEKVDLVINCLREVDNYKIVTAIFESTALRNKEISELKFSPAIHSQSIEDKGELYHTNILHI